MKTFTLYHYLGQDGVWHKTLDEGLVRQKHIEGNKLLVRKAKYFIPKGVSQQKVMDTLQDIPPVSSLTITF